MPEKVAAGVGIALTALLFVEVAVQGGHPVGLALAAFVGLLATAIGVFVTSRLKIK